jgi:hypothetical protein
MILFIKNLFSKNECEKLNQVAFAYLEENKFMFEGKEQYYANSYGYENLPEYTKTLKEITPRIIKIFNTTELRAETVYTRAYFNGSTLKKHTDRKYLDLSLSACTFKSIEQDWPIYIEKSERCVEKFVTEPGDAVLFQGRQYPHWRDDLVCKDDQLVLQTFFHWRILGADKNIQQPLATMV